MPSIWIGLHNWSILLVSSHSFEKTCAQWAWFIVDLGQAGSGTSHCLRRLTYWYSYFPFMCDILQSNGIVSFLLVLLYTNREGSSAVVKWSIRLMSEINSVVSQWQTTPAKLNRGSPGALFCRPTDSSLLLMPLNLLLAICVWFTATWRLLTAKQDLIYRPSILEGLSYNAF